MNRAGLIDDLEGTRELQAHVTWLRGAHAIKSGLQLARMGFDVFRPEYPSGQYVFGNGFTQGPNPAVASTNGGFGFATFLLGQPTGGQITGDRGSWRRRVISRRTCRMIGRSRTG